MTKKQPSVIPSEGLTRPDYTLLYYMRRQLPKAANLSGRLALDVGCGSGMNCVHLANCGFPVIGVDNDLGSLVQAGQRRSEEKKTPTICSFVQADARHLPFAPGSFDLVTTNNLLECLPPDEQYDVLAHMRRVTKSAGVNIISGMAIRSTYREQDELLMLNPEQIRQDYEAAGWRVRNTPKNKPFEHLGESSGVEIRMVAVTA